MNIQKITVETLIDAVDFLEKVINCEKVEIQKETGEENLPANFLETAIVYTDEGIFKIRLDILEEYIWTCSGFGENVQKLKDALK